MRHTLDYKRIKTLLSDHILSPQSILIGVSWGPDSVALLSIIQTRWTEQQRDQSLIHILTCDHNTRENIQKEIQTVTQLTENNTIHISTYTGTSHDENSLRQRRHREFIHHANMIQSTYLILWHHLDDRIESTFLNMQRGCHIWWILSMTVSESHFLDPHISILRPLIETPKQAIVQYCNDNNLPYHIDPTNNNASYSQRNKIRKTIQNELMTPQLHKSFSHLYTILEWITWGENHNFKDKHTSINKANNNSKFNTCLPTRQVQTLKLLPIDNKTYLSPLTYHDRTSDLLISLYQQLNITINPRSTTLSTLVHSLQSKSGSKISYQGVTIQGFAYASRITIT